MKTLMLGTLKHSLRVVGYGACGMVLALLVVLVVYLNGRPDLSPWHKVHLDEEFTRRSDINTFAEYLALEERLFQQLDEEVYGVAAPQVGDRLNRYMRDSLADPERWPRNWNRSYELEHGQPRALVLLLHGLSDSPYSLHHLAQTLHEQGAHVLNLRLPGHGTAPSGLVWATWKDMEAAVRLAVRHLHERHPGLPLHFVGYSNGAALGLLYELATLDDPSLPQVDRLVLVSPEIGVSSLARFARTQARLGKLLGLEKLAWNDLQPEYDPFKYNSFAINAGNLSYEITHEIQNRISDLTRSGDLGRISDVLALSSVVDATVSVTALVEHLFRRLPAGGHELVLFDINRNSGVEQLLRWDDSELVQLLSESSSGAAERQFALSLLTNVTAESAQVQVRSWLPGSSRPEAEVLGLYWPEDIYSLTHVALPFPPGDSLYGGQPASESPGIKLGELAFRGERGVLQVSAAQMLRLRWNPFYPYLEQRVLEFLGFE
jgi:hypothetical protein